MKKLISVLLCLVMVIGLIPAVTMPASAVVYTDGDWQFTVSGSDACITAYKGSDAEVTVPSTLHTKGSDCTARSIDKAFYKNGTITSVTIPEGVTSIDNEAFYDCTNLAGVTLPSTLKVIGYNAFCGCGKLTSVTIPDGVTTIGMQAFGATGLKEIDLPDSVTSIGTQAFYCCYDLKKAWISCLSTEISNGMFFMCSSLTYIDIPVNVTAIGDNAFSGCSKLEKIYMYDGVATVGANAFNGCSRLVVGGAAGVHYYGYREDWDEIAISSTGNSCLTKANLFCISGEQYTSGDWKYTVSPSKYTVTVEEYTGSDAVVTVPSMINGNPVTRLMGTFKNNETVTGVIIPNGVTSIGNQSFWECSKLKSVTIPDSLRIIGHNAFYCCSSLASVTIPANVKRIGNAAFQECVELTEVVIPDKVESIKDKTFRGCSKLESVTIPDSVETIGEDAFYNCSSLRSVTIPANVKSIGAAAFKGCCELTGEVVVPGKVESIEDETFRGCTKLESVTIPDSVETIGSRAFDDCSSLQSVTIPANVKSISYGAFWDCDRLTEVVIPGKVEFIGEYAFRDCDNLARITIPVSVTNIGSDAFSLCSKLALVKYGGTIDQWNAINNRSKDNLSDVTFLCVPAAPVQQPPAVVEGGIKLTWNAVPGAGQYKISRKDNETGSWSDWSVVASNVKKATWTDTDVKVGKQYKYRIKAYGVGSSAYSNVEGVTMTAYVPTPTNLKVTSGLDGITVKWSAVTGAAKYRVIRTVDGSTTKIKVNGTSWTDSNVEAGKIYTYSVQAQDSGGTYSAPTETKSLYYPLGLSVKVSGKKANTSWTPVSGATKYQLYRRPQTASGYGDWELVYSGKATSFPDTPGSGTWQYRVRAVVGTQKTPYSNRKKITIS